MTQQTTTIELKPWNILNNCDYYMVMGIDGFMYADTIFSHADGTISIFLMRHSHLGFTRWEQYLEDGYRVVKVSIIERIAKPGTKGENQ